MRLKTRVSKNSAGNGKKVHEKLTSIELIETQEKPAIEIIEYKTRRNPFGLFASAQAFVQDAFDSLFYKHQGYQPLEDESVDKPSPK